MKCFSESEELKSFIEAPLKSYNSKQLSNKIFTLNYNSFANGSMLNAVAFRNEMQIFTKVRQMACDGNVTKKKQFKAKDSDYE